jgi:hypothetical protein
MERWIAALEAARAASLPTGLTGEGRSQEAAG